MLSLLEQSYELSKLETEVSVEVEQLTAMQTMSVETLEFDNKCYARHLSNIPCLVNVGKLMVSWAAEVNTGAHKVASFREAQAALKTRVQEALRRTAALQNYRDPGQDDLLAFEALLQEGYRCYDNLRRRRDTATRHNSLDMVRIVYNCFKQIDISLRNEGFGTHLKQVGCCEEELQTVTKSLTALRTQVVGTRRAVMRCQLTRQKETWTLIQRLATSPQKEPTLNSMPKLNLVVTPPSLSGAPSPSVSPPLQSATLFIPPPHREPSPLIQHEPQVPRYPSPPASLNNGETDEPITPATTVPSPGFDTSDQQVPLVYSPAVNTQGLHKPMVVVPLPKSPLDSDNLIQDNINIRYAMQDSIVSFTQCSNAIAEGDFDWSYLDLLKK